MGERVVPVVPGPDLTEVNVENPSILQQSSVLDRKEHAVCVRHAFKDYGSKRNPNRVLSDLNMVVGKGTIYGLLGASGCGKTTLLSCIVGRKRLNSGEIFVLGGKPGTKGSGIPGKRVGYMPQETALYGEFSIKETMLYFGWIFGMDTSDITERLKFLLTFLDLPSQNRLVKNLSGGQQRRVSFAVALMHDPELLILDEPTVGVDPLLRQSIWNHLVQITKDGNKTVILTTHYIEEAREAHTIGLMRNGKLLAQQAPSVLLSMYGCTSLEDVFLKLSRKQGKIGVVGDTTKPADKHKAIVPDAGQSGVAGLKLHDASEDALDNADKASSTENQKASANWTTTGKMKALLTKNVLRMWRNVTIMLFIFGLPVIQVVLFCLAIGGDPKGLKLAIVNDEVGYISRSYQECPLQTGCNPANLSCRYINEINTKTISKVYYPDIELAKEAVTRGEVWGVMYFTENFSTALIARLLLGKDVTEEVLDQSEIKVWLDMTNQQISLILQRDLQVSFQIFTKGLLRDCDQNEKLADIPISFEEPIYGSSEPKFTDFIAPGVILTIVFFLAVALTSSSLIIEKVEGLLDRSCVAGVSSSEILFSHIITQFVVMCGQTTLVLVFMTLVFGIECKGDIAIIAVLTILQGLCGMCFGFVISAICELERNSMQLALGSFYPTLLLSGIIWPIESMPTVLRYVATFLPLTLATTSLRAVMSRGWSFLKPDVYYGFISTAVWIVVFLTISLIVLKIK